VHKHPIWNLHFLSTTWDLWLIHYFFILNELELIMSFNLHFQSSLKKDNKGIWHQREDLLHRVPKSTFPFLTLSTITIRCKNDFLISNKIRRLKFIQFFRENWWNTKEPAFSNFWLSTHTKDVSHNILEYNTLPNYIRISH
jgi:hypothetical protein